MLAVEGLSKSFGGVRAVDDVSLVLPKGEIRALIGPNGAGKTTLFNMLTGQLRPDAGEVRWKGARLSHARRTYALLARAPRLEADGARALLDQVGLADQAERPAAVLAYGDLKRLELAVALANDPELLLLDEPTAGMAPAERGVLMALVERLARERG